MFFKRWIATVRLILGAFIVVSVSVTVWLSSSSSSISDLFCHENPSACDDAALLLVLPHDHSIRGKVPLLTSSSSSTQHITIPSSNPPNHKNNTNPVRILLGISSLLNDFTERQRRHVIRNTYLDFDRLHSHSHSDPPNRVCSLQEFVSNNRPINIREDCRLIYTFILGPPDTTSQQQQQQQQEEGIPSSDVEYGAELPASLFEENRHETDVIYLNVNETDGVGKRWGWFHYASLQMNATTTSMTNNNDSNTIIPYLAAAYTDAHVLLKPTRFWQDNPLFSAPTSSKFDWKGIYAGLPNSKENCPKNKCASLRRETVMRRFVLLSSDLVHTLANKPIPTTNVTAATRDSPDVAIANALPANTRIQEISLQGLVAKVSKQGSVGDYLNAFDQYKDGLVDYQDAREVDLVLRQQRQQTQQQYPMNSARSPRLLLGIFSMDSPLELERREMIRNTYLRAFVKTNTPHRICSLTELLDSDTILDEQKEGEEDQQKKKMKEECQVAYVFVVSGNPGGPKELVEVTDTTGPIILEGESSLPTSIRLPDHEKGDIVYLNIQENGKEGKSQTYFKFATTVLEKHYFDYLVKTDSDTLIYPKPLLNELIKTLPTFPNNMRIYGGDYRFKPSEADLHLGPAYFGGHLYFMSPDLARYITSPACNRTALAHYYSEDQSIGNFVHSLSKPIRRVWLRTYHFDHPVKRVDRMRTMWNKRNGKPRN